MWWALSACLPVRPEDSYRGGGDLQEQATAALDSLAGQSRAAGVPLPGCPATGARGSLSLGAPESRVPVEIVVDEVWSCANEYELLSPIIVRAGASLVIGPDTHIRVAPDAYVFVQPEARLIAEGLADGPIVFSSGKPEGERAPGDWRGVIVAGAGPSHAVGAPVPGTLPLPLGAFGGGPGADLAGDSGVLRYVRIEFAGGESEEEATPGAALTLAACGSRTVVDHVQVHRSTDGVGIIGGSVNLSHLIVTDSALGNAVEWTGGYTGALRDVLVQSAGASPAIKGSNSALDPELTPVSHPVIENLTAVGVRPPLPSGGQFGVLLQMGSELSLSYSILTNFDDAAIDLRSARTLRAVTANEVSHLLVFGNGPGGTVHLTRAAAELGGPTLIDVDPGLLEAQRRDLPSFVANEMARTANLFATDDAGLQSPAPAYVGGLPVDGGDWTRGWTAYPQN